MKRLDISLSILSVLFFTQSLNVFALTEKAMNTPALKPEDSARVLEIPFEESPYPVILNRMPFGAPPDPNALAATTTTANDIRVEAEKKKLAESFSWTAINITPEGKTAIGFTDLSAKPQESYYITVGESAGNWKLIQADYTSETATIEKEGIQISLKFGDKNPITPTAAPSPSGTPGTTPGLGLSRFSPLRTAAIPPPSSSGTDFTTPAPGLGSSAAVKSYRDRLAERMKAQEDLRQESERTRKEEFSKIVTDALRKQQEEAAAAAALQAQETPVVPEGQPIEVHVQ